MSWLLHSQNLNELPAGRKGWILRHGRAWLHLPREVTFCLEWSLGGFRFHVGLDFSGDDVTLQMVLPLVALYLSVKGGYRSILGRLARLDRCVGLAISDWTIRVDVWTWTMGWRSKDPWWSRGLRVNLPEFFLGDTQHSERTLETFTTLIPMPERSYRAVIAIVESSWKRPRWPWPKRLVRAKIDMAKGEQIPIPGKGENSWDCGEDATYGLCTVASTPAAAVAAMVQTCLETRYRHGGGLSWRPEPGRKKGSG